MLDIKMLIWDVESPGSLSSRFVSAAWREANGVPCKVTYRFLSDLLSLARKTLSHLLCVAFCLCHGRV